jgi:hypothetical protein
MNERNYLLISAMIFAFMGLLHLVRVITHWSVQIGAVTFPLWGSWLALLLAAVLCVWAFRLMSDWRRSHP